MAPPATSVEAAALEAALSAALTVSAKMRMGGHGCSSSLLKKTMVQARIIGSAWRRPLATECTPRGALARLRMKRGQLPTLLFLDN